MIMLNSMTIEMVKEKTDQIEPATTMNSANLAAHEPTINATTDSISNNMTGLAAISPNAMANADTASTIDMTVDEN